MKTDRFGRIIALFLLAMAFLFCVAPSGAAADGKKAPLTYLDTLNQGKEIAITAADFNQQAAPQPAVTKNAPTPPDTAAAANAKAPLQHDPGVVESRFRIQVLASTHQDQVRQKMAALAAKINVPVSISFETPYYKLFAGEFTQRGDAENCLAQVKKLGYNDAWISRTAVSQKQ
jgi:hypothetical protein